MTRCEGTYERTTRIRGAHMHSRCSATAEFAVHFPEPDLSHNGTDRWGNRIITQADIEASEHTEYLCAAHKAGALRRKHKPDAITPLNAEGPTSAGPSDANGFARRKDDSE